MPDLCLKLNGDVCCGCLNYDCPRWPVDVVEYKDNNDLNNNNQEVLDELN